MNEPFRVVFRPSARKAFLSFPKPVQARLDTKIQALAANPRGAGTEKLAGVEGTFRVRAGEYRILYEIHDDVLMILVVRIGHRRDVYR